MSLHILVPFSGALLKIKWNLWYIIYCGTGPPLWLWHPPPPPPTIKACKGPQSFIGRGVRISDFILYFKDGLLWLTLSEMSIASSTKSSLHTPGVICNKLRKFLCVLSGTFLLWRSMRNYIFINRSNLSITTDLFAWHVEAIQLPNNMLKDRNRSSGKIWSYRNTKFLNQGN